MITIGLYGTEDPEGRMRSHDHGVAVMKNGKILFFQELERLTGVKHDGRLPRFVDLVVKPWLDKGDKVQFVLTNSFLGSAFKSESGTIDFGEGADLPVERMQHKMDGNRVIVAHEISHLGACLPFFGRYKPNSLLVHIDGGASDSCASAWYFDGTELRHLDHGWHAGIKTAVNNFNDNPLSFRILGEDPSTHLSLPGKLMGLAGYGRFDQVLSSKLSSMQWNLSRDEAENLIENRGHDIACCMQREFEEQALGYIRQFKQMTGASHLYYSGGAALNIHANVRIEYELGFKSIYIPPVPSDSGLALGGAAFVEWQMGENIELVDPFLNVEVAKATDDELPLTILSRVEDVATRISEGKVVAVYCHGFSEAGPRALGRRSLLARPDSIPLRKMLSEKMKQREWYRPIAPIMRKSVAQKALKSFYPASTLSRYMLGAWQVQPGLLKAFAGVVHEDGTVRAQVVEPDDSKLHHMDELLYLLEEKFGMMGLINTSFNSKSSPIVNSLKEARRQAHQMGIEYIWIPS